MATVKGRAWVIRFHHRLTLNPREACELFEEIYRRGAEYWDDVQPPKGMRSTHDVISGVSGRWVVKVTPSWRLLTIVPDASGVNG